MAKQKRPTMVWITRQSRLTDEGISVAERVKTDGKFILVKWRGCALWVLPDDVHNTEAEARLRVDGLVAEESADLVVRLRALRRMKATWGTKARNTLKPKGNRS